MRIRKQCAGAFAALMLIAAYLGLAPSTIPTYKQSDKVLHFVTFFAITLCFYWIIETNRRRVLQLTFLVCPVVLGLGSEVLQGLLPNGRDFDPFDVVANMVGSLSAIGLCTWYHRRMLERKRQAKTYHVVPGDDADVELGEGIPGQKTGVTAPERTVEEELDNWDENAEDWDEEPESGEGQKTPTSSADGDGKK